MTKVHGKVQREKIPRIIAKLNKALGLKRKSQKIWDILSISDHAEKISNNAASINKMSNTMGNTMAAIAKYHPETSMYLVQTVAFIFCTLLLVSIFI